MKTGFVACLGMVVMAGMAGVTGCSAKEETSKPAAMSAADLQTGIADRLTEAGSPPKSVTCKDGLAGEVGKTARCDVAFDDTNSIEALVTATGVDGSNVDYDMTPAMTKEQVEKAVTALAAANSATCTAGVDGTVGASTTCETTLDGATSKQIVEVAEVVPAELGIELSLFTLLPKQTVEEVLMQKLNADGQAVETVDCVDDVVSKVGSTIECAAVTGNDRQGYDVTLTEVQGDNIDLDYTAKS